MKQTWLWLSLALLPAAAALAFSVYKPILVLPRIGLAPGFSLTTDLGQRITSEDLRGRLVLYNFTYSRCEPPCPQTSQTMQAIQAYSPKQVGLVTAEPEEAKPADSEPTVKLITISVDPAWDTSERLQSFAASLGAQRSGWTFATGPPESLKQIVGGGFNTYYSHSAIGEITLEPAFILVDGWGIQRAEYRTEWPDLEIILRDIDLLQKEAINSKGAMRYAYEAAHLFLCYP